MLYRGKVGFGLVCLLVLAGCQSVDGSVRHHGRAQGAYLGAGSGYGAP